MHFLWAGKIYITSMCNLLPRSNSIYTSLWWLLDISKFNCNTIWWCNTLAKYDFIPENQKRFVNKMWLVGPQCNTNFISFKKNLGFWTNLKGFRENLGTQTIFWRESRVKYVEMLWVIFKKYLSNSPIPTCVQNLCT